MGKLTISMAMFNSKLLVYQRVNGIIYCLYLFIDDFPIKTSIKKWDFPWRTVSHNQMVTGLMLIGGLKPWNL